MQNGAAVKICTRCKVEKDLAEFYVERGRPTADCKECRKARVAVWYRNGNFKTVKNNNFRFKYGITLADYDAILETQGGVCAICGGAEDRRALHVDHDHETGEIRGILCGDCNTGLGAFKDSTFALKEALAYLEGSNRVAVEAAIAIKRKREESVAEALLKELDAMP